MSRKDQTQLRAGDGRTPQVEAQSQNQEKKQIEVEEERQERIIKKTEKNRIK